ncbi:uncharacterized protein LOC100178811 [Ciona intestinalis]
MNLSKVIILFVSLMSGIAMVASYAIPDREEPSEHKISKRSSTADHSINENQSRQQTRFNRQLFMARLMQSVDTSGERPNITPSMFDPSTTTTKLRNAPESGSGRGRGRKHRKRRRNRGGRKKNRNGKRSRRGRRHPRSIEDSIAMLMESAYGDEILNAIAAIVEPAENLSGEVAIASKIVQKTARKCECKSG